MNVAVIIPTLGDTERLANVLSELSDSNVEIIVVDGAPNTTSERWVCAQGARWIASSPSRGRQVRQGIAAARADWVWVVHADTRDLRSAITAMQEIADSRGPAWGRFTVAIPGLPLVAALMNWRSRRTKICTGDQCMFFHRTVLDGVGGFPDQPLMEDIEISKRLKDSGQPFLPVAVRVTTSARRWHAHGVTRTVLTMWWFRIRYFFGSKASTLYNAYYRDRQ